MKRNNNSGKVALGAMLSALSVVILMPSAIQAFVYALPPLAGALVAFSVIEMGKKWAFSVYFCTSAVSIMLIANKEAVILYLFFFGYYPILKAFLEEKCKKPIEYILKLAVFNIAIIGAYLTMLYVFGIPFDKLLDFGIDMGALTKYAHWFMLAAGNVIFIMFDIGLSRWISFYLFAFQKKFRKLFKFSY